MKPNARALTAARALVTTGAIAALAALSSGCGATRYLAVTAPPPVSRVQPLDAPVIVTVRRSRDDLSGGHHEGLIQMRQPWIWGVPEAQRRVMLGHVPAVLTLAIGGELQRQGIEQVLAAAPPAADTAAPPWRVTVDVGEVEVNTYGPGILGWGSAGDYWECRVGVEQISIERAGVLLAALPPMSVYAKTEPSPAQIGDLLVLATDMLRLGAGDITAIPFLTGATYAIDRSVENPLVMAGRHIGARLAAELATATAMPGAISGGTRSEVCRRSRDTFASVKKTC